MPKALRKTVDMERKIEKLREEGLFVTAISNRAALADFLHIDPASITRKLNPDRNEDFNGDQLYLIKSNIKSGDRLESEIFYMDFNEFKKVIAQHKGRLDPTEMLSEYKGVFSGDSSSRGSLPKRFMRANALCLDNLSSRVRALNADLPNKRALSFKNGEKIIIGLEKTDGIDDSFCVILFGSESTRGLYSLTGSSAHRIRQLPVTELYHSPLRIPIKWDRGDMFWLFVAYIKCPLDTCPTAFLEGSACFNFENDPEREMERKSDLWSMETRHRFLNWLGRLESGDVRVDIDSFSVEIE